MPPFKEIPPKHRHNALHCYYCTQPRQCVRHTDDHRSASLANYNYTKGRVAKKRPIADALHNKQPAPLETTRHGIVERSNADLVLLLLLLLLLQFAEPAVGLATATMSSNKCLHCYYCYSSSSGSTSYSTSTGSGVVRL
jgi:hypothetical protein